MSIRAIIGMDHLPADSNWPNYISHGVTRGGSMTGVNLSQNIGGWICSRGDVTGQDVVLLPLARYMAAPVAKITFGFRLRMTRQTNTSSALVAFNGVILMSGSDIPNNVTGMTCMVELNYTIATGVVERRVNGVNIANTSYSSGQRSIDVSIYLKANTANYTDIRDIYVSDDQNAAQGHPVNFLGSVIAAPLSITAVQATNYTTLPAGQSLLDAIYQPGSVPADLVAVSDAQANPLKATVGHSLPQGPSVLGVEFITGLKSEMAGVVNVSTKLTVGSDDLAMATLSAPIGSYNYDRSMGALNRAPDGGAWTRDKVLGAVVTLQPAA